MRGFSDRGGRIIFRMLGARYPMDGAQLRFTHGALHRQHAADVMFTEPRIIARLIDGGYLLGPVGQKRWIADQHPLGIHRVNRIVIDAVHGRIAGFKADEADEKAVAPGGEDQLLPEIRIAAGRCPRFTLNVSRLAIGPDRDRDGANGHSRQRDEKPSLNWRTRPENDVECAAQ